MNRQTLLPLIVLSLVTSTARAAEVAAPSKIVEVTVYQDRALVVREAEVELAKGDNTLVFEGLPGALLEESLRGEGRGAAAVTLHGAELKKVFTTENVNIDAARIESELEKLRDERRALEMREEALANQRAFLDSVRNFSSVQVPKDIQTHGTPPAEWTGLAQFLVDSYESNSARSLELELALREKDKAISAKQNELNELYGAGGTQKRTALLSVEAAGAGRFTARLSYIVPQAVWTLSYDARVDVPKGSCALVAYGNVRQWSGEDWNDARLVLSSAKPAVGGRMPELSPWLLDFYAPPVPMQEGRMMLAKASRMANVGAENDAMSLGAAAPASAPVEAVEAQAAIGQELGTVTYAIGRAATVKSDNSLHRFPVTTEDFSTAFDYETTPKLSPYVYLHAKVTNDKDHPLPGGPVNIFAGPTFVGRSFLTPTGRNEKFDLYLGVDEEVKVKRTELVEKRKKAMLGLRARKDYTYKIEVENYKKAPARVVVVDQIPVSRNAEIKAEYVSATIEPSEKKDLGILRWNLDVVAGGKKEFEFQFFVEHPADKAVPGV